jgi:hypothetical protein
MSNVVFVEWTVINKGTTRIDSAYLSLWTDIDFGVALDNLPAVDTLHQLAYLWYGAPPGPYDILPLPAVGYVLLFGPRVPSEGDTAVFRGMSVPGWKNLPMSSFWGIMDDSYPTLENPWLGAPAYTTNAAWTIARGLQETNQEIIDPTTGQPTKFPWSGDPVTGQGWLCPNASGGSGFNFFSGPFTLAPGDTQWIMVALVPARGNDRFDSVTRLRTIAGVLKQLPYEYFSVLVPDVEEPVLPGKVTLFQNYPNPFNAGTIIRFELQNRSRVTLEVIDVLGRRVAILVDEEKEAGRYSVAFQAGALASGFYSCRLQAQTSVLTRKLLVVK